MSTEWQYGLSPPLKWAGGKRWMVPVCRRIFPRTFNTYIEPFAGSAAIFFALSPKNALLADSNAELINFYRVLRDDPKKLVSAMRVHSKLHSHTYYYEVRAKRPSAAVSRAARFLYLNRTCWNGLYRENKKGQFNVPIGTKTDVLMNVDDFPLWHAALQGCDLTAGDFEETIGKAGRGDLVFVDPPYTVAHNNNGFIKYNQTLFSWQDQVRLAGAVSRAAEKGAYVFVTNAPHESIRELYRGFKQRILTRSSVLAGQSVHRKRYEEMVIQCY